MTKTAIIAGPLEAMALEYVIKSLAWRTVVVHLGRDRSAYRSLQDDDVDIIVGAPLNGSEISELMGTLKALKTKPPTVLVLRDLAEIDLMLPTLEPHVSVVLFRGQVDEIRNVLQVAAMGNCVRPIGLVEGTGRGDQPIPSEVMEMLTRRERDVMSSLTEGLSNKEIARSLGISRHTVGIHVGAIMRKFQARSRTEVVARLAGQHRLGNASGRKH